MNLFKFFNKLFHRNVGTFEEQLYGYASEKLAKRPKMQIYSIYGDDVTPEILAYLDALHAQDTFLVTKDDYVIFWGVETQEQEQYIFITGIDVQYNKKLGFFQKVNEWPSFMTEKTAVEEIFKHKDRTAWPQ